MVPEPNEGALIALGSCTGRAAPNRREGWRGVRGARWRKSWRPLCSRTGPSILAAGMVWSWSFRLFSIRGVPVYVHASHGAGGECAYTNFAMLVQESIVAPRLAGLAKKKRASHLRSLH